MSGKPYEWDLAPPEYHEEGPEWVEGADVCCGNDDE